MNPTRTPNQPPAAPARIVHTWTDAHTLWLKKPWVETFTPVATVSEHGSGVRYYLRGLRVAFWSYLTEEPRIVMGGDWKSGEGRYTPNQPHEKDACFVV